VSLFERLPDVHLSLTQFYILRCWGLYQMASRARPFILHGDTENRLLASVVEMQAFLVTLIRKFTISHADHQPQIKRAKPGLMTPVVLGEGHKGPHCD